MRFIKFLLIMSMCPLILFFFSATAVAQINEGPPKYPLIDQNTLPPSDLDITPKLLDCSPSSIELYVDQYLAQSTATGDTVSLDEIAYCGINVVSFMSDLLNHEDEQILIAGLQTLAEIGSEAAAATPDVVQQLEHPSSDVRSEAARALAQIDPDPELALPVLIPLLNDSEGGVNSAVVYAIEKLGVEAKSAIPELNRLVNEDDGSNRKGYLDALAAIGGEGIDLLIHLLSDPDEALELRISVANSLGKVNQIQDIERILPALTDALEDPNDEICSTAAYTLRTIGQVADSTIPNLIDALISREACEYAAMSALGYMGTVAVNPLLELLQEQNRDVQPVILDTLQSLLWQDTSDIDFESVIPTLLTLLEGEDSETAYMATELIGLIGAPARALVPSLVTSIVEPEDTVGATPEFTIGNLNSVQASALGALGKMGADAVPSLIELLESTDDTLQIRALVILGEIGPDAQLAVPNIYPLLQSDDENLRLLVAIVLAKIGVEDDLVLAELIAGLGIEDKKLKAEIVEALGNLGPFATPATYQLIASIGEGSLYLDDWKLRDKATKALVAIGPNAIPALISALGNENSWISARSSYILTSMGAKAIPSLVIAMRDSDPEIKRRAAFILGQIGPETFSVIKLALQDRNADVRIGAMYALGEAKYEFPDFVNSLQDVVSNEFKSLDERRIAASVLEEMGYSSEFLAENNLPSPLTAICTPERYFEFDIYTGQCLTKYKEDHFHSGVFEIVEGLCCYFECLETCEQ